MNDLKGKFLLFNDKKSRKSDENAFKDDQFNKLKERNLNNIILIIEHMKSIVRNINYVFFSW